MKTSSSMNGLNSMKFLHNGWVLIIMGLFPTVNPAGTVHTQELPTAEFLEFLSEWETDQGEWVGPALFEDDSFDQLFEEADGGDEDDIGEKDDAE
jgi:hypothetical protein